MLPALRIGLGFDIHRLEAASDGLIPLAGVLVPAAYRVVAHSDGDVALHALCDAILGAHAAGDLGEHFPDNDARYRGCDSSQLLAAVLALPCCQGMVIHNVDINIIAETPRLMDHKAAMRQRLSELLSLDPSQVSIKARSHEQVDAIGEKKAIGAQAIVLLSRGS
ncbi:MAG: 2-C-methyl-D-erythritol 2,4-cyclodiphosphate synthase [Planctomycetota bacterium]|nr:MAG: 2-C-methyl-D-erythritol 2,4-cyclodiphosphate synthase [Planctomycetota bacterium]